MTDKLPKDYAEALTMKEKLDGIATFKTDGCSNAPDSLFGKTFANCCHEHDFYYKNEWVDITRKEADEQMFKCMKRRVGWFWAFTYWSVVRMFGGPYFKGRKLNEKL